MDNSRLLYVWSCRNKIKYKQDIFLVSKNNNFDFQKIQVFFEVVQLATNLVFC